MKMTLLAAGLAILVTTGFVVTSACAEGVEKPVGHTAKTKSAAVKRMKKDGTARKDNVKIDYYTIEREKMMKISM